MLESDFQKKWIDAQKALGFEAQKFQDRLQKGIPDTFFGTQGIGAWVEFKVASWPRTPHKPLLALDDYTSGQIPWLKRWHLKPCPAFVLVGVSGFPTPGAKRLGVAWVAVPGPLAEALTELPADTWIYQDAKTAPREIGEMARNARQNQEIFARLALDEPSKGTHT